MTQRQRRKTAWRKWRKLVSKQEQSGQSVAAFCQSRRLSTSYFFQWKKKLSEAEGKRFVEVKMAGAGIEVRLRNDLRLLVQPGFDANHVQALLAILENRA